MREADLLAAVQILARRYDVDLHHAFWPVADKRGWPDCALIGTRAAAFRELKSATGRVTADQKATGARMRVAGLDWDVWRPDDLTTGRIETEIAALSGKRPWPRPRQ